VLSEGRSKTLVKMSMKRSNKFSCVIVGGGTLLIRCAEILLNRGHEIRVIVSADMDVRRWAGQRNLPHLEPSVNLSERLGQQPFDYLFSIVNEQILHDDVLKLPHKLAINYHDAPLPKYAGTHATSWALMNGETSHGITWHVITEAVDAGDVLKQRRIEIAKDDTALTLNTKCYEAAINAFSQLVDDLSSGNTVAHKQNLDERTFFARHKRPANGCVISWSRSASDISALVRALDFGPHPNPLGSPKFAIRSDFIIFAEAYVSGSVAQSAPGTIIKVNFDSLSVSTVDGEITLCKALTPDGQPISIPDLVARFDLHEGYRFTDLDSDTATRLDELYRITCKHENFWVKRLSSLEPAVFPYASSNAASAEVIRYASEPMPLPDEVVEFLEKGQAEWSVGDLLLAAFCAFLARLGRLDSFDVGYCDPDLRSETAGLGKCFAAHLPLRAEINCSQSFAALLDDVKEQVESLKKHKTYARDLVTRYPQLRSAAVGGDTFTFPIVVEKMERSSHHEVLAGSELTLIVSEDASECSWVYDRDKLRDGDIARLSRHFTTFLRGIAASPDQEIAYLPLLSEDERHQVLVEWNDTKTVYDRDKCIHELLEAQVERTPDAVALIFGEQRLTYRELDRRANQLAHYLQAFDVGPEVLVGICVERSIEMIIGICGVLKAGGAYVPLDPAYPKERLALMLEDSRAPILLTQSKLVAGLNQHQAKVVCLDRDWDRIAQESGQKPSSKTTGKNLAYVIYTSGSTGKPKGVAIEHRSTIALLHWATSVFTREQLKGVLASTSMCFDLSIYEMFAPLSCGGTIILVENVLHLPTTPAANEVTLINTVPSAITELLRSVGVPDSVRTVNLAGEPLKSSLVRQIYQLDSVQEVFDLYGPTEDTTYSTFALRNSGPATIGRPISNTQAYILDRYLQPVPVGIPGELYLGGDGLARGYLNRPELTEERFITNPYGEEQARLYKTGDLTRYLPTGEIEYLGRIDNQVKIRGFRIELGEIESAISAHPGVRESVVVAREDQPGDKRLVAYVISTPGPSVKGHELRSFLKQKLPDHMVPSLFVALDELPLTPNGKVNRKALPAPASTLSESERDFVQPRDEVESQLIKIWEDVLGVQPIGVTDNFFDLGGDSLHAVRMFTQIEQDFVKSLTIATLFQAGTIEQLANILRQDNSAIPESSLVAIQPGGTRPPFFCIHAKGGNVLFYRDLARRLGPDQPFYGLQARRVGGRQVGHATVEEMADFYIKEIQTIQPEGPYFLGGASFGGLVAFELAQQLHAQGHKIGLLALLDTGVPSYPKMLPSTTRLRARVYGFVRRVQHHRDSLRLLNSQERVEYVVNKLEKVKRKVRRIFNRNYKKLIRKYYSMSKQPLPKDLIHLEDKIWRAGQKYVPRVYPGRVTLFRASNQPLGIYPDLTLGWDGLAASGLEIYEVPGHHGAIVVEPYVRALAEELSRVLEKAQGGDATRQVLTTEPKRLNDHAMIYG
jgi:amino acid adenylation domain-containing protein